MLKVILVILIPTFYFFMSWFFPWDMFQGESTISVSYAFDLIFSIGVLIYFKEKEFMGKLNQIGCLLRLIVGILVATACVYLSKVLEFNVPFKYLDNLGVQLLFFAPIFEELVFRGAFYRVLKSARLPEVPILGISAILFSFSHIVAIWHLPPEFHGFVGFQVFYTLILGWLCTKSRIKSKGLVAPMIIHFSFNLVFYIAVIREVI